MRITTLSILILGCISFVFMACSENDLVPPVSVTEAKAMGDAARSSIKDQVDFARPNLGASKSWTNTAQIVIVSGTAENTAQKETINATIKMTNFLLSGEVWTATGEATYVYNANVNNDESTTTYTGTLRLVNSTTNYLLILRNLVIDVRQDAESGDLTTTINGGISIDGFSYSWPKN